MKTKILYLILAVVLHSSPVYGQYTMYTLNWNTSISPAWPHGWLSGFAPNIGGSGVTSYITITSGSGSFQRANPDGSGAQTPTVSGSTYKAGPFSPPNNLMIAVDYSSPSGYTDIAITFTPAVYYLNFYMGDIDRYYQTRSDFVDQLIVEGNGKTVNPTFTKYYNDSDFPNQLVFAGDTVKVNPNANLSGNAGSDYDVHEDAGSVFVNFGPRLINAIRIRYNNGTGVISNPTYQAIAISNMSFTTTTPLPVKLISFDAHAEQDFTHVKWTSEADADVREYIIERSKDGSSFVEAGRLPSLKNTVAAGYFYNDNIKQGGVTYYRLKTVGSDGSVAYSKVCMVNRNGKNVNVDRIYPSHFNGELFMDIQAAATENVTLSIVGMNGVLVSQREMVLNKGFNKINILLPYNLPLGQYMIHVRFKEESRTFKGIRI